MSEEVTPSFSAQVRNLRKSESVARVERLPLKKAGEGAISESIARLRRTVNATVSKLREEVGSNFRVESGSFITHDNEAVMVAVTVTRT